MQFTGDALFVEAAIHSCGDGSCLTGAANPRLGAPWGANWADFPRTEDLQSYVGAQLARVGGLGLAVNLLFLFAAIGAAVAMFACARWLEVHAAIAGAAGLLYAFSPYLFTRNEQHLGLTLYALAPVGVLVWRQLAQAGTWSRGRRAFLLIASAAMGLQVVYYAAYFLVGCAAVGAVQAVRRRWYAVRWAVACVAACVAAVSVMSVDTIRLVASEGFNSKAVVRSADEARIVGLWPEQLFIPSTFHRWAPVRALVEPYAARVGGRGEYPSAYLGVAGAAALVALLIVGVRRAVKGHKPPTSSLSAPPTSSLSAPPTSSLSAPPTSSLSAPPTSSLSAPPTSSLSGVEGRTTLTATLVLFWLAMTIPVGGIALFGRLTGTALLRSNNRISIVLLAIALLWGAHRLSRWARGGRRAWMVATASAALGLFEQVPLTDPEVDADYQPRTARAWDATATLVAELEARAQKPLVFVYPPAPFPEDPSPPFGDPYLPLQLYVRSTRAAWSFGGVRGRQGGDWPAQVASLPDDEFAVALRRAGFNALVTTRAACPESTCLARVRALVAGFDGVKAHEVAGTEWIAWTWAL